MEKQKKSGFIALVGRPNVGKSTLMNHLIGQKIAITSRKPQTTRNQIRTVYTDERGQAVFLDTPGIHKAQNRLGTYMVEVAQKTFSQADIVMWLVEPTTFIGRGEQEIAKKLRQLKCPVFLIVNKTDTVKKEAVAECIKAYRQIADFLHLEVSIQIHCLILYFVICRMAQCIMMRILSLISQCVRLQQR